MKKEKDDEMDATCNRLTELTLSAKSGSVFLQNTLVAGTDNSEQKSCISRQGETDTDAFCDGRWRVPAFTRIARA